MLKEAKSSGLQDLGKFSSENTETCTGRDSAHTPGCGDQHRKQCNSQNPHEHQPHSQTSPLLAASALPPLHLVRAGILWWAPPPCFTPRLLHPPICAPLQVPQTLELSPNHVCPESLPRLQLSSSSCDPGSDWPCWTRLKFGSQSSLNSPSRSREKSALQQLS